jgi:aminoglycoside phosphotransferase (APT) family kinase protein
VPEPELAARLVDHLRSALGSPALDYADPPAAISGGFDTRIFSFRLRSAAGAWSAPLILRLFRADTPPSRVRFEAATHEAVRAQGYPAPGILLAVTGALPLGGPFLVMERAPGERLLARLVSLDTLRFPALLAAAQLRLHALDPAPVERAAAEAGLPPDALRFEHELAWHAGRARSLGLAGLGPGVDWLESRRPPRELTPVVCHGDFHPFNLIAEKGRLTGVIDWTYPHVKVESPAFDVGATIALLSHGPVTLPGVVRRIAAWGRARLVALYRDAYLRERPLTPAALDYFVALRLLGFLVEAGEHRLAELGARARPEKPTAFGAPEVQAGVVAHFRALSGVTLALP